MKNQWAVLTAWSGALVAAGVVLVLLSSCTAVSSPAVGSLAPVTVTSTQVVATQSTPMQSTAMQSTPTQSTAVQSITTQPPGDQVPGTVSSATAGTTRTVIPSATPSPRSITPSAAGPSTGAPGTRCAARILAGMSQAQKVGQLIMVAVPADNPAAGLAMLGAVPVGGVFLSGRSTDSAEVVAAGIASLQHTATATAGVRLHVAVDQEGGFVQSLRGPDFPAVPSALEQGAESVSTLAEGTTQWAAKLVEVGITLDLAPVADIVPAGTEQENPPIGQQDRQYGSTPDAVAESVRTVVTAMLGVGLGTTVKHFPGLGRVRVNTDTSADAVDGRTTGTDDVLEPFRAAVAAHTTAVMVSLASYPRLDDQAIAALSAPIITGLLRNTMGFKGLIMSDDLGSAVAVRDVPVGLRAVDFVRAGGDMALTVQPADLPLMTAALAAEATLSPTFRDRVDDAALHVLQSKQALGMLACP